MRISRRAGAAAADVQAQIDSAISGANNYKAYAVSNDVRGVAPTTADIQFDASDLIKKYLSDGTQEYWPADASGVMATTPAITIEPISSGSVSGTFVSEGVMTDAAAPWEDGVSMSNNAIAIASTGVDLTEVDNLIIHFERTNNTWPTVHEIDPSVIKRDIAQGAMFDHFDNSYLAIHETSQAQLEAGDIQFRAITNQSAFGLRVTKIEFKKRAVVLPERDLIYDAPTNSSTANNNLLNGMTWQNVSDDYEKLAWTAIVSGVLYGGDISLDDFADGVSLGAPLTAALHFILSSISFSDGQFNFAITNHAANASQFKLWGVREGVATPSGIKPNKQTDLGTGNGNIDVSFAPNRHAKIILDGNATLTFSDPADEAAMLYLLIEQDGAGGHSVTWPTLNGPSPSVNPAASSKTVVQLYFDGAEYHTE